VAPRTRWGGLLFLLNTATDADLPGALLEEAFDRRPMPWLVHQLATRLAPALPDDPAVLALAGLDPDLLAAEPPSDAGEAAALDECATRWGAVTAARLRAADPEVQDSEDTEDTGDAELLRRVVRRTASVVREPGWVELHLELDDVDLGVRRAGLDVDPGWVWWLGQIVRFVHE
jgi:hypothetical protein